MDDDCDGGSNDCALTGELGLSEADARLVGVELQDYTGLSVAGAGDVDGDGYDDFLVGAPGDSTAAEWAGAVYLFLGSAAGGPSGTLGVSEGDAALLGYIEKGDVGQSVDGSGDTDGDGNPDILVGDDDDGTAVEDAGCAWLVLGPISGSSTLGESHLHLLGEAAGDHAGYSVSFGGDLDADGYDEVLVGAPYADSYAEDAGAAYVVYGQGL